MYEKVSDTGLRYWPLRPTVMSRIERYELGFRGSERTANDDISMLSESNVIQDGPCWNK